MFVGDLTPIHDSIWQLETMQGTWHVLDVLDLGHYKYEVMLLCFQNLIPFCFRLKES
jgi:hypothetical protein